MHFQVGPHTIFVTLAGSQAHGTARPGSDVDLRGVCVAPLRMRLSFVHTFEQYEGPLDAELWTRLLPKLEAHETASRGLAVKVESSIVDIAKFVKLCANGNPNALEILFADERDWLYETPLWHSLHRQRRRFLSLKIQQTYLGYAMAQLKRIRSHRAWLLNPPAHKPERSDFGLPERGTLSREDLERVELAVVEKLRSWDIDALEMPKSTRIALKERLQTFWEDLLRAKEPDADNALRELAGASTGLSAEVLRTLDAERKYRAAMRHWEAYQTWKEERNDLRAQLEARFGYDTKHAAHLIRLMRSGLELLETGDLCVRRPDAEELNAIRDGALSYDALLEHAEQLKTRMHAAIETARLPKDVDYAALDDLLFELLQPST